MGSDTGTVPHRVAGAPVRTVRVDVVDGPDRGRSIVAGSDSMTIGGAEGNDLVLRDSTVSRYHAELSRCAAGILVVDTGSTNGIHVQSMKIERGIVPPGTVLRLGATSVRLGDGDPTEVELSQGEQFQGMVGRTATMRRMFAKAEKAAASASPVLVVGESGTGKELLAAALHELGPRAAGPFVTVDCGSLAPTLIASDLFGHERGAFTGADNRRIGAFELAHRGTLFLDEIGELPEVLQPSLLGVIERGRFRRVGGSQDITVDVRVVSATNRDLRAEVNAGRFRLDLYFRLAVITLALPSLRERKDDIPLLIESFLRECGHVGAVSDLFSAKAIESMVAHHWPGNVRELRNFVEAMLAMGESATQLGGPADDDSAAAGAAREPEWASRVAQLSYKEIRRAVVDEFEREYVERLVAAAGGNVSQASRTGRIDRSHLNTLLRRHRRGPAW